VGVSLHRVQNQVVKKGANGRDEGAKETTQVTGVQGVLLERGGGRYS